MADEVQKNIGLAVIIPAYNASRTIARAIVSALAEPEVTEVVVVDDVSTDDTIAVAKSCDDGSGRLKVFAQTKNGGPSAARNRAIAESTAPFIALLDSDDFFEVGRMAGLLAFANDADFIADDLWQVTEDNVSGARRSLVGTGYAMPCPISLEDFVLSNVTRGKRERGELGFIKPIMRRSFLQAHGITYREDMRLGEDYELYVRSLAAGARLLLVPAQGYISVIRTNSLSSLHSEGDLLRLRDCNARMLQELKLSDQDQAALRAHYSSIDCRLQWRLLINAVKARDIKAIVACFTRPYPVQPYLIRQLAHEFLVRVTGKKVRL